MAELEQTAVHESGHAIAGWLSGSKLCKISIGNDGNGETLTNHPIFKVLHEITYNNNVMKNWIFCLLSGVAAELYFKGGLSKKLPDYLNDDIEVAMRFMRSRNWKAPTLLYTPADFFQNFGAQAKGFAIMRRPQIVKLADLLVEKREISGFECAIFLEKIWPEPLPTKALRYWEHKK